MIIAEAQQADSSDAASTNTLVTDELQKLPRHLIKLVYTSLFLALLSFVFVLVDNVDGNPILTAGTIIAFVFTLPHHGASILLGWLQHHQTESIFPFTPHSPRAIAYSVFLTFTWVASTVMCAISLYSATHSTFLSCSYNYGPDSVLNPTFGQVPDSCTDVHPGLIYYWPSFVSTITSSLEFILITSITIICWLHRRPKELPSPPSPPSPSSITSETKIISA